jgi:anti-sigma regulatory factor (Ser/Thr protein kinase)
MRPNQQPVVRAGGARTAHGAVRLAAVTVPAAEEHVAFVRLAALHVAGVIGLGPERAADFRLAVGEACAQFLPAGTADAGDAAEGSDASKGRHARIAVRFELSQARLRVTVRGRIRAGWPDVGGLGWLVLTSLVGDLHSSRDAEVGTLTLVEHLPSGDGLSFAVL